MVTSMNETNWGLNFKSIILYLEGPKLHYLEIKKKKILVWKKSTIFISMLKFEIYTSEKLQKSSFQWPILSDCSWRLGRSFFEEIDQHAHEIGWSVLLGGGQWRTFFYLKCWNMVKMVTFDKVSSISKFKCWNRFCFWRFSVFEKLLRFQKSPEYRKVVFSNIFMNMFPKCLHILKTNKRILRRIQFLYEFRLS